MDAAPNYLVGEVPATWGAAEIGVFLEIPGQTTATMTMTPHISWLSTCNASTPIPSSKLLCTIHNIYLHYCLHLFITQSPGAANRQAGETSSSRQISSRPCVTCRCYQRPPPPNNSPSASNSVLRSLFFAPLIACRGAGLEQRRYSPHRCYQYQSPHGDSVSVTALPHPVAATRRSTTTQLVASFTAAVCCWLPTHLPQTDDYRSTSLPRPPHHRQNVL